MDELQFLEDAETKQEDLLTEFYRKMRDVSSLFYTSVLEFVDGLSMTPETRMQDWKAVTRYRLYLRAYLANAGYDSAVDELFSGMRTVALNIEAYYEPMGMQTQSDFFHNAGREALERVQGQVMDAMPDTAYVSTVSEILESAVMRGQRITDLRRQLKEVVVDSDLPANYIYNQTRQGLWMFHRNYSSSIGAALGLAHYYYDGVKVAHSRQFCIERKGKVFTKKEIEGWAARDWQGKIAGTTKQSIFWLCGGYNCIDVLRPITKELYARMNNQN